LKFHILLLYTFRYISADKYYKFRQVFQFLHEKDVSITKALGVIGTFYRSYRLKPAPEEDGIEALHEWRRQMWGKALEEHDLEHMRGGSAKTNKSILSMM